jgi:hypothetical protein
LEQRRREGNRLISGLAGDVDRFDMRLPCRNLERAVQRPNNLFNR